MDPEFVFLNDAVIPVHQAALLVSDLAIQRGYGIFDFLKTIRGEPVFMEDHLNRFYRSAAHMRLPVTMNREELTAVIHNLMQKNQLPDSGIRITLTGGYSPDGYATGRPNLIITQKPLQLPSAAAYQKGLRLVTYAHQRQMADVKTIDYLMAIWLQPFIRQHLADDVLYHHQGILLECPRANIFLVTGKDTVVTPCQNILKGIIRMKTLSVAGTQFHTEERDISIEELPTAKEAFITSSTKNILPVVQINDMVIGNGEPGPLTRHLGRELQHQYHCFLPAR